ncbi:MAG: right-handed parallel beta-helix repeat-containing protein [Verrucomicrobiota bacterium]
MSSPSGITNRHSIVTLLGVLAFNHPPTVALAATPALTLFVSPDGNDSSDGSPEHPFASPERARLAIRSLKSANTLPVDGILVSIQPGSYSRSTPLLLTAEDAGSPTAPIVWKAASGKVTFDAGIHILPKHFQPVDEETSKRLAPEAKGHVLWVDLNALAIRHKIEFPLNFDNGGNLIEFYFNGERLPLSRWPNSGSATMERVTDKADTAPGEPKRNGKFIAREDRVATWPVDRGVWVEGYWRVPWDNRTLKVASIDPATREITLAAPVGGGIGSKYGGPQGSGTEAWWAVNLLEEIDQPGEWCVDFKSERLYWWPKEKWQTASLVLSDMSEPLIRAEKTAYLRLEGFQVENGLANGIEIRDSQYVEVVNCTARNLAGSGIVIQRGEHNTVRSCDVSSVGHSGIVLSGGNRTTLQPCDHLVDNNHIQKVGILKKTYAPGILVGIFGSGDAVGARVSHNFVHDVPHGGIQYGGNNHIFEYNEVSHSVLTSDDMGAFYTTNDWTSCGNILRYNFVHHSPNAVAFYMDDGDGGDTIFGNIAYEMQSGPSVCGGHYNTVLNNLVFRCKRGLFMDSRGVPRVYDKTSPLFKKLKAVPFDQAPWTEQFPYLKDLPDSDTRLPQGNLVARNVTGDCEKSVRLSGKTEELKGSTLKDNLDLQKRDPGFVDESKGDLTLKPDSVIFKELPDFEVIPFQKIGLYKDEFRSNLPDRQLENPPKH